MSVSRRRFLALSSATAALSAVPLRGFLLAQAPHAAPPVPRFGTIRRDIGYFTARGGTIGWFSGRDALVVVDTQFPDTAKLCLEGLRERAGRAPDLVLNTHHHGDHTGGNGVFKAVAKRIVAHARVPELQQKQWASQQAQANPNATAAAPTLPDTTFDKVWSEAISDENVSARHYGPAHTGGDAIVRFERANVVHLGDLLFHQVHPFVDRPAGASIQNWMQVLETITKEMPADTVYLAGHAKEGLPVTVRRQEVLAMRDYFDAVLAMVRKGIAAGQPKDTITALTAVPGFEQYTSPRLPGVLGVAYDELTTK